MNWVIAIGTPFLYAGKPADSCSRKPGDNGSQYTNRQEAGFSVRDLLKYGDYLSLKDYSPYYNGGGSLE